MLKILAVALVAAALGAAGSLHAPRALAQGVQIERLRFQLVSDEPLLAPDGRGTVAGQRVEIVRDRATGECYVALFSGPAAALTGPVICP